MTNFRTPVISKPSHNKIGYQSRLMLMGSCFSENMGMKFSQFKFCVDNNPFGIIFNPSSVKLGLERLLSGREYTQEDLGCNEGLWFSFHHHGRFSNIDPNQCLTNINQQLAISRNNLLHANFLFITFGTAYIYEHRQTGQVVANCHKMPAIEFNRRRLSVDSIVAEYSSILTQISTYNPNLQVVFTVSPVRHWKDGPHENQISKSILLLAIDSLCQKYPNTFYYPSYELVMDDLRDYRFYEEDMLHPNTIAINYIWADFTRCFMLPQTITLIKDVEKIVQAMGHRPFNADTPQYLKFARATLNQIYRLQTEHNILLPKEETYFTSVLTSE
jgi:hypothetical protein